MLVGMRKVRIRKIILASASPWRRKLLKGAGIRLRVEISGHKENLAQKLPPRELVQKLALEKAKIIAQRHPDALIIAADTVAVFRGNVIGKPRNVREARKILKALSGVRHSLLTGFAVLDTKTGRSVVKSVETKVWFRKLTSEEIDAYVRTKEPLTAAGGYAIQGGGASFARRIDGDFYNVVGLPLSAVVEELRKFDV